MLSSEHDVACIIKKKEEQKGKVIKAIGVKRLATIWAQSRLLNKNRRRKIVI